MHACRCHARHSIAYLLQPVCITPKIIQDSYAIQNIYYRQKLGIHKFAYGDPIVLRLTKRVCRQSVQAWRSLPLCVFKVDEAVSGSDSDVIKPSRWECVETGILLYWKMPFRARTNRKLLFSVCSIHAATRPGAALKCRPATFSCSGLYKIACFCTEAQRITPLRSDMKCTFILYTSNKVQCIRKKGGGA